jgi:CDP-glucose 4,6-dehydratase
MLGLNKAFWRHRRVLVTGHTGFKGGWLCLWLRQLQADVTGYALAPPTTPALFDVARIGDDLQHNLGDLRDAASLDRVMRAAAPEVVFHLAAQPLVREGYRDPVGTVTSNIIGTMNVLEAMRRQPSLKAAVIVTSDKCYLNREWSKPYGETDALGGKDPYSASKACAELLTAAWRDSFFTGSALIATARAGNVIGGGDWAADRLVPDALRAWQAGEAVAVRNPAAVRPWQHVLEPLAGYLQLAEQLFVGKAAGAWNFGPRREDTVCVANLLDRLAAAWGATARWQADTAPHPPEAGILQLDSTLARTELGWRSRLTCREAVGRVVDWHRAWLTGQDLRDFSVKQILEYMERPDA